MTESVSSSEMSVKICYTPQDNRLLTRHRENQKPHSALYYTPVHENKQKLKGSFKPIISSNK
jgi:hypothetical protein